jgi:hypothetical protein
MSVLKSIFSFDVEFQMDMTHNMFIVKLNFQYKNLQCIKDFVSKEVAKICF